jgi:small subunit ribosomal protein S20
MPNTKSAIRRTRKTKVQALVNRVRKSKFKLALKQMNAFLDEGKLKEAKDFFPKFNSKLMKIAKTGVVSKKNVARKISRIAKKIGKLKK